MKGIVATIIIIPLFISALSCKKDSSESYHKELMKYQSGRGDMAKSKSLHEQAMSHYKKKQYPEAEKFWYQAAKANPAWAKPFFNLCCINALNGKKHIALDYLELALARDYDSVILWARGDKDLTSLRNTARYKKMVTDISDAKNAMKFLLAALKKRDLASVRSMIHEKEGLTISNDEGSDTSREIYKPGEFTIGEIEVLNNDYAVNLFINISSYTENGIKYFCVMKDYTSESPPEGQGGPTSESWTDICFALKHISGKWYFIEASSGMNGGT